jgi:hypothetical protein
VRRVELILQQLESLPTLSPIAVRLLQLTTAEDADAKEVIQLVSSDPALAARVLKLCRCHARGRASIVTSVDRAVLLLGFEAVRCAVLSVQVFELFDGLPSAGGEVHGQQPVFNRRGEHAASGPDRPQRGVYQRAAARPGSVGAAPDHALEL